MGFVKNFKYEFIEDEDKKFEVVDSIVSKLPKWFDENGRKDYPETARKQILLVAFDDEVVVGFVALQHNNDYTSNIYSTGVLEEYHGNGIGRMLVNKAENYLRENGFRFLTVKTLSDSSDYEPYKKTRAFYKGVGFYPLEENKEIWGKENPCLTMIKNI